MASMDIAHDRAGYYLLWGCLVWVPVVYTGPVMALALKPRAMGPAAATLTFAAGCAAIAANYDADRQRQAFRAPGGRRRPVWGAPPRVVRASYVARAPDGSEERREALLLASGWWGVARHLHYLFELAAAAVWTAPNGWPLSSSGGVLPYFYLAFLTILLTDRAFRDDARCAAKYGDAWRRYCGIARWRILPGVL